jgi:hypothetical protein
MGRHGRDGRENGNGSGTIALALLQHTAPSFGLNITKSMFTGLLSMFFVLCARKTTPTLGLQLGNHPRDLPNIATTSVSHQKEVRYA